MIPDEFKQGVRGILLLHRNKDGASGNAQRKSFKRISTNVEQWNIHVEEMKYLQKNGYSNHRIYASVNARNMHKAVFEFKTRQLSADNFYVAKAEPARDWFYLDVQNNFFSCLMNPNARETSYFLIDCDTVKEYEENKAKIPSELILLDYPTKNGRHLITKPFNPKEIIVEIKKDDLLYIG